MGISGNPLQPSNLTCQVIEWGLSSPRESCRCSLEHECQHWHDLAVRKHVSYTRVQHGLFSWWSCFPNQVPARPQGTLFCFIFSFTLFLSSLSGAVQLFNSDHKSVKKKNKSSCRTEFFLIQKCPIALFNFPDLKSTLTAVSFRAVFPVRRCLSTLLTVPSSRL